MTASTTAITRHEAARDELLDSVSRLRTRGLRRRFLAERPDLLKPECVATLTAHVPKLIKADLSAARAVADCAYLIVRAIRNKESAAFALRAKANLFHVTGKNRIAVKCHDRAASLFEELGNQTQVARTLSASIQPLILLGEYDRAQAAAAKAAAIFKNEGNDWRLARVELNTGNIFDRQDRFSEALEHYQRAYESLWLHRTEDPEAIAVVLHNLGGCYVWLNDFRHAVDMYEQARSFAAQNQMPTLVAQADYNIAWLHYLRGEYTRAISQLRTTRDACQQGGDRYHFALCHLDLSEIYLELNMGSEAAEAAAVAQSSFNGLAMPYEEGKSAANLGLAHCQRQNFLEAQVQFDRARTLFLREKNQVWCALLDFHEAVTLFKQRNPAEARRLALAALAFFERTSNPVKTAACRFLLARIDHVAGDLTSADRHCHRALSDLADIESPSLIAHIHSLMAQIQKAFGNGRRAFEHFQNAKAYLEQLRNGIRGDELKIAFMRDRGEIYEGLVDLCLDRDLGSPSEAFAYIEQVKSRSLLDLLAPNRALSSTPDVHSPAARQIQDLRKELNWYHHRIEIEQLRSGKASVPQVSALRTEASKRECELLRLLRENPPDENTNASNPDGCLSLEHIQQSLNPDATIVEYFQIGDRLMVALLTSNDLEYVSLGKIQDVEDLLHRLRFQMAKLHLGPEYVTAFEDVLFQAACSHLRALYCALIAPIRSRLRTSHLIVVPHGPLHHLPFHTLYDGKNYLIDDFTLSYSPSASIYSFSHHREANTEGSAVIFAIPDPAIPLVEAEARAVAGVLPKADLVVGDGATSARLADSARHARFVHISTHGYFREDQPMFSGIRLADSTLSLYDLYQMRLPVELVVLSGCSTGLNVVSPGDEILGLARGLISAGAQSALLTLWDVHDESTVHFMTAFYEQLSGGRNKAEAARQAALILRKSYSHPYYWAPFILIGKVFPD